MMNWRQELRDSIMRYFSDSDIKTLCFDLGLDYDELSGDNKTEKVISLIDYFNRHNAIRTLIASCSRYRPNVPWNEIERAATQDKHYVPSQNITGPMPAQPSFPWLKFSFVGFVMIAIIAMFVVFLNMASITIEPKAEVTRSDMPIQIDVPESTATSTVEPEDTGKPTARVPTATQIPPSPTSRIIPTPTDLILYTRTEEGVAMVSPGGEIQIISDFTGGYTIDIEDNELYLPYWNGSGSIYVLNLEGDEVESIPIPNGASAMEISVLPDKRIALMGNHNDQIHFIDPNGTLLASVDMHDKEDDQSLQNLDGVVVANHLIVSEDGYNNLLKINLDTYEVSTFRELSSLWPWLGCIDFFEGYYYLTTPDTLYRLTQTGPLEKIISLPAGNITGLVVVDYYAYVTINFTGEIYRINLIEGTAELYASGLDYPFDLDYVPYR